ncbi:hypothetical protein TWF106_009378 [Orbilia oligospora]|uniref:NACHT domain-containing protein n=1 Tax=Orbilia oligospora TaxID=2813651 RepID=A0A7C8QHT3_ORBOL|nr:hypothetical protein TWF106_009378 [Orbilia oligospora]
MSQPPKRSACCDLEDPDCCGQARRTGTAPSPLIQTARVTEIIELDDDCDFKAISEPGPEPRQDAFRHVVPGSVSSGRTYERPAGRQDFHIAIICALPIEYNAISLLIDQWWDEGGNTYGRAQGDPNMYRNGRLGEHNVVLLLLPKMGKSSAAGSTASLRSSYCNISLALLVGICGGVPYVGKREILLGDVIIGERIFQYDFGRQYHNQHVPKAADEGNMGNLNKDLSSLIAYFKTEPGRQEVQKNTAGYLATLQKISIETKCETNYRYPGISQDRLFPANYQHKHQEPVECSSCIGENETYCRKADKTACVDLLCDDDMLVRRQRLKRKRNIGSEEEQQRPEVFVGNIASGDTVMRSSEHRDAIAIQGNLIAFEMEGAGAFDESPSLVIKGVCDYADSHKNKDWQPFAAATAASVAKAVLERYTLPGISTIVIPDKGELMRFQALVHSETGKKDFSYQNVVDPISIVAFDEQDKKCLADLRVTNPIDDKARITQTKGNLLKGSYLWILEHEDFKAWGRNETQLLWITGDPGKGKTMLLCGLIEELGPTTRLNDKSSDRLLAYFLFQGTDSRINNATAALRSLIYMLVNQHPTLILAIREKYDASGKQLFQDPNAWFALSTILTSILEDFKQCKVCIVIDALDECITDLFKLLDLVIQTSKFSHVQWILSSRNITDIERGLQSHISYIRLGLEQEENAELVSKAVETYIKHSIVELKSVFEDEVEVSKLHDTMLEKSNGTFLWVSLITKELKGANSWELNQILEEFPEDLWRVYSRMIDQVKQQRPETRRLCSLVLSTVAVVYRPLHLEEIYVLSQLPKDMSRKPGVVRKLVDQCGSFFTIRESYVYIIHQSAMDFLSAKGIELLLLNNEWKTESHHMIFSQSLKVLSNILRRDIYNLKELDFITKNVSIPDPDPLASIRYSCVYWIDHFSLVEPSKSDDNSRGEKSILGFLKVHFLHWLEALSLIGKIQEGIRVILLLESITEAKKPSDIHNFVYDARRFILSFGSMIQETPLQTYYSALSFAPQQSLVRQQFKSDIFHPIDIRPVRREWGALLQTLKAHESEFYCLAISLDNKIISLSSYSITLWDLLTGSILRQSQNDCDPTWEVAISPNGNRALVISTHGDAGIWDITTGSFHKIKRYNTVDCLFKFATFSVDGERLLIALKLDKTKYRIEICRMISIVETVRDEFDLEANSLAFSSDGRRIAYIASGVLKLWDIAAKRNLAPVQSLNFDAGLFDSNCEPTSLISFSPDDKLIALAFKDTIWLLDGATGKFTGISQQYRSLITSILFSPDSTLIACALEDTTVNLWSIDNKAPVQKFEGHKTIVRLIAFSPDSKTIATASGLTEPPLISATIPIQLWETATGDFLRTLVGYNCRAHAMAFSSSGKMLLLTSGNGIIQRWDAATGEAVPEIKHQNTTLFRSITNGVYFSPNAKIVASLSYASMMNVGFIQLWDRETLLNTHTLEAYGRPVVPTLFSPNGKTITAVFNLHGWCGGQQGPAILYSWEVETGVLLRSSMISSSPVFDIALSPDGGVIAFGSREEIGLFNIETCSVQKISKTEGHGCSRVFYSPCGKMIAFLFFNSDTHYEYINVWDTTIKSFLGNCGTEEPSNPIINMKLVEGEHFYGLAPDWETVIIIARSATMESRSARTGAIKCRLISCDLFTRSAFSPDGRFFVTGSYPQIIRIWEAKALKTTNGDLVDSHESAVVQIAISQNQDISASLSYHGSNDLKFWSTVTGKCLYVPEIIKSYGQTRRYPLTLSPDGTKFGYLSDNRIKLLTFDSFGNLTQEFLLSINDECNAISLEVLDTTFSSDNKELVLIVKILAGYQSSNEDASTKRATGYYSSNLLLLYDASSGEFLRRVELEPGISQPTLSPNGEIMASANGDPLSYVEIRAIKGWRQICTIAIGESKHSIRSLQFSESGEFLLVKMGDFISGGIIAVCETLSGTIIHRFGYHQETSGFFRGDVLPTVTLSPDYMSIYIATGMGVLHIPYCAGIAENTSFNQALEDYLLEGKDYPAQFSKLLTSSDDWILQGGRKIFRLPVDYRVYSISSRGNLLMLGARYGMVLFASPR